MKFLNLFKKKFKKNELEIFEEFRIPPTEFEMRELPAIKKYFKKHPIPATLIGAFALPEYFLFKGGEHLYNKFKSSIRGAAINQVSHNIRKKNKKAYQYSRDELEKMILKEESRIKKKGRLKVLKIIALSQIGIIPMIG
jgi:hypothetical protein